MTVSATKLAALPLRSWFRWHLIVTAALALFCGAVGWAGQAWEVAAVAFRASLLASCIVPGYLTYEHFRRQIFLVGRAERIVPVVLGWAALQILGLTLALSYVPSAGGVALAMAAATLLAAMTASMVAGAGQAPGEEASVRAIWRSGGAAIAGNTAAVVPYMVYNTAMPIVVGSLADAAAAGVFSATRLFLAPVNTFAGAIGSVDKPRAAHALRDSGPAGLKRVLRRTAGTLTCFVLPYAVIVMLGAEWLLVVTLGSDYVGHGQTVRLWAVVGIVIALGHPVETGLVVLDRAGSLFWSRMVAMTVALATLYATADLGATGAVLSVLAAWLTGLALGATRLAASLRASAGRTGDG
jgi:O-antigen/teichoic acid export membrane protein